MQNKKIELAHKISKDLEANWLTDLSNLNLRTIFSPIYLLNFNISTLNAITAYIIFAYDNDSTWLDLKRHRRDNKIDILKSILKSFPEALFDEIIDNEHDQINDVIGSYLESQATWKFKTIVTLLTYHENMIRFVNQKTEAEKKIEKLNKEGEVKELTTDYDIDIIVKVNKQKGELLEQAIDAREKADKLIEELNKEFVHLNNAVQQDFSFQLTDEKKINPESWRDFVKYKVRKEKTT